MIIRRPAEPVWTACEGGFECATAKVPLDYRKPHGKRIELALIMKMALGQEHRIGSVFLNPGGPGGSGVEFIRTAPPPMVTYLEDVVLPAKGTVCDGMRDPFPG